MLNDEHEEKYPFKKSTKKNNNQNNEDQIW
jgi:hypothetical protein